MSDTRQDARSHYLQLSSSSLRSLSLSLACIVLGIIVADWPAHEGLSPDGRRALFIMVAAAALWLTEAIPAFAVSLLIIGMSIFLLGRPADSEVDSQHWERFLAPWGSHLIWLFFGGFVLACAAEKTHLDRWMAGKALAMFGQRPAAVVLGVMLATALFSMFISNTATATVMLAALAPLLATDTVAKERLTKALLLAIAFGANLGGMGTVIGTPPNAIAAGALEDIKPVNFSEWMVLGMPPALILLLCAWLYLIFRYLGRDGFRVAGNIRLPKVTDYDADPWQQAIVVVTFSITVLLWMTSPLHGIPTTVVAMIPPCALTATATLTATDIRGLPWDILLLIAGGLTLGVAVEETGLAKWLVQQIPTGGLGRTALVLTMCYLTIVLSNLMSNTGTANLLIPIALVVLTGEDVELVVAIALSASAAMCLPISTPPNAIVYSSKILKVGDLALPGLLIGSIVPIVVLCWLRLAEKLL